MIRHDGKKKKMFFLTIFTQGGFDNCVAFAIDNMSSVNIRSGGQFYYFKVSGVFLCISNTVICPQQHTIIVCIFEFLGRMDYNRRKKSNQSSFLKPYRSSCPLASDRELEIMLDSFSATGLRLIFSVSQNPLS